MEPTQCRTILDGKSLAQTMQAEIAAEVAKLPVRPGLATVLVGDDPASQVYVRNKRKACELAGMASFHEPLPADITQSQLLDVVARLNDDPAVHGILVQLPLPKQIDEHTILRAVRPEKDVDGFGPESLGLLDDGGAAIPCRAPRPASSRS